MISRMPILKARDVIRILKILLRQILREIKVSPEEFSRLL